MNVHALFVPAIITMCALVVCMACAAMAITAQLRRTEDILCQLSLIGSQLSAVVGPILQIGSLVEEVRTIRQAMPGIDYELRSLSSVVGDIPESIEMLSATEQLVTDLNTMRQMADSISAVVNGLDPKEVRVLAREVWGAVQKVEDDNKVFV